MELIAIAINVILLIVFIVMAGNIAAVKTTLKKMYDNGYVEYSCTHKECGAKFYGKQPICPTCKGKIGW